MPAERKVQKGTVSNETPGSLFNSASKECIILQEVSLAMPYVIVIIECEIVFGVGTPA
jgi:hypothetical protein